MEERSSIEKKNIFSIVITTIAISDLGIFFYVLLLSEVRRYFHMSEALVQLTVAMNMLGLGVSSFVYGSLSDILGRRKLVLFGIFLFCISSLCIGYTNNMYILFLCRFLQGVGGGVSWSVGNAILHDIYSQKQFEKAVIITHAIVGIMSAISPMLGGTLGNYIGWQNSFKLMGLISFLLLLYSIYFLPETLKKQRGTLKLRTILNNYHRLLSDPLYLNYLIIKTLMVSGYFVTISNLSLLLTEVYNVPSLQCGNFIALGSLLFALGSLIANRLNNFFATENIIYYTLITIFLSSLVIILANYINYLTPFSIQIIKIPYYIGLAFILSNASHKIINRIPSLSGSASSIMLTAEMLTNTLGIFIIGYIYNRTIYPLEGYILTIVCISLFSNKQIFYSLKKKEH